MTSNIIYPPFLEKLSDQNQDILLRELSPKYVQKANRKYKVVISFDSTLKREDFISKEENLTVLKKFDVIPSILLHLTRKEIESMKDNGFINTIEEDQKIYLSMLDVKEIINLNKYRKSQIVFTGKNIIVGIIDNGINRHFDSISDIRFDRHGKEMGENVEKITHGTLMANIIGNQYLDYDDNYVGIAPNVKILDLNISKENCDYFFSDLLQMFDLILNKNLRVDIILIPFTTLEPSEGRDILSLACNLLVDKGILIVCPAGNFGPESFSIGSPSAAEKVITIGALTKDQKIAYYSGRGPTLDNRLKPDFCLPGSKVEIPLSNEVKIQLSGSCVAASFGVGIIALIKEHDPEISAQEVKEIIKRVALKLDYDDFSQGHGSIDVVNIFKSLDLYQEKTLPYNYLMKRSLAISIEFVVILLTLVYFLFYFIDFQVSGFR